MDKKYKGFIVIDGKEKELDMIEPWNEKEMKEAMDFFKNVNNIFVGLKNGEVLSISKYFMPNVYFIAKPC